MFYLLSWKLRPSSCWNLSIIIALYFLPQILNTNFDISLYRYFITPPNVINILVIRKPASLGRFLHSYPIIYIVFSYAKSMTISRSAETPPPQSQRTRYALSQGWLRWWVSWVMVAAARCRVGTWASRVWRLASVRSVK